MFALCIIYLCGWKQDLILRWDAIYLQSQGSYQRLYLNEQHRQKWRENESESPFFILISGKQMQRPVQPATPRYRSDALPWPQG